MGNDWYSGHNERPTPSLTIVHFNGLYQISPEHQFLCPHGNNHNDTLSPPPHLSISLSFCLSIPFSLCLSLSLSVSLCLSVFLFHSLPLPRLCLCLCMSLCLSLSLNCMHRRRPSCVLLRNERRIEFRAAPGDHPAPNKSTIYRQ